MEIAGKTVLIIGYARSGIAAAKTLRSLGAAKIILNDAKAAGQLKNTEELNGEEYVWKLGMPADELVEGADMIVISPSVPPSISALKLAAEKGIPVYTEIELGYRLCQAQTVAITGTNGKTTTTTLTGQIFADAQRGHYVVGNIGLPYSTHSVEAKPSDVMVTEISSYQLECIIDFKAHVAALLNITPDHLNRHGSMENYIAVKKRVFENQTAEDYAVLNYDDETVRAMADTLKSKVVFFSRKHKLSQGVWVENGHVVFKVGAVCAEICACSEIYIKGGHNLENAMAAAAIGMLMGVSAQSIAYTLKTFRGVEHRIETVRTVKGVTFINDSKGTNPDSTVKAIQTMQQPTVLILGGYDKGGSFDELIAEYTDRIEHTIVLGATKEKLEASLKKAGKPYTLIAGDFEEAVNAAFAAAKPGWNVLLSPACASFDMFKDFEERGRVFKQIVNAMQE